MKAPGSLPAQFLAVALMLSLATNANATVLGVSPATVEYTNTTRGGTYQKTLMIGSTDKEMSFKVAATGEAGDWFNLDNKSYSLTDGRYALPLRLTVPDTVPNGIYEGRIMVTAAPQNPTQTKTGMYVGVSISARAKIEVTGSEGTWFRVLKTQTYSSREREPIRAEITVKNSAMAPVIPTITFTVLGYDRKTINQAVTYENETVDPKAIKTITATMPSKGMKPGLYFVNFRVSTYGRINLDSTEPFYIISREVKEGGVNLAGALDQATISSTNLTLGDGFSIKARFKNTGDVPVNARMMVEMTKGGETAYSLTGTEGYVIPNETKDESVEYKPPETGEYKIRIWFEYSGLKTAVRSSTVKVWAYTAPIVNQDVNFYTIAIPGIIVIAIWLLMYYRKYYLQGD